MPGDRAAAGSQAGPTERRPAPARRDRPGHRQTAEGVPVRRAAVQPRRGVARPHAHRTGPPAPAHARHHGLRHPRPGGSDDDGDAHRGDEPGPHRAGRHADGGLPAAEHPLRRRLRRHAGHEFPACRPRRGARQGRAVACLPDGTEIATPVPAGRLPSGDLTLGIRAENIVPGHGAHDGPARERSRRDTRTASCPTAAPRPASSSSSASASAR